LCDENLLADIKRFVVFGKRQDGETVTPAEILRNRARAVGCDMTVEQADGTIAALRSQGYKITARDCGESGEVALDIGPVKVDGTRDVKLATDSPNRIWALIWDQHA
jgi:hypothetical protein